MYKNKCPDGRNNICGVKIKELRQALPQKTSQRQIAELLQREGIIPNTDAFSPIRLKEKRTCVHEKYYSDNQYLFPADNENGIITNNTVYNFYRRMCKKLGIEISREVIKGTHSFRRNAITDVVNAAGGNIIMASQLFGNSPEVAKRNYYAGAD